ncbi:DUF2975 domain-containing protein [Photobacterium sp. SDRW27]|uniref:DUF2975 domain-containing protein n=1 Tax=Photobacterium obscurum TaxID=2829490 RepID=UPI002243AA32|nr:DUF2975 domain-containing protein [Photobacterium obscurum]MCW8331166.1 DUF2975 domain-containing protein [Photobacterium obscurum]
MPVQHNIQKLSRRLLVVLWVILISTPVSISFLWFYGTLAESASWVTMEFSYEMDLPFSVTQTLIGYPFVLIPSLVYTAIIWQLIRLFGLYRAGDIFTFSNVSCFRKMANLMIASPFVSAISDILLGLALSIGQEDFTTGITIDDSDMTLLVVGLIVRAISHVMMLAKDIKEENELTV